MPTFRGPLFKYNVASIIFSTRNNIISIKKNIADSNINPEAVPLVKSFVLRTLLSLSVINFLAILLVKYDTNMPEGISEDMKIYPMIMHGVLGLLPLIALYRMSQKKIGD